MSVAHKGGLQFW